MTGSSPRGTELEQKANRILAYGDEEAKKRVIAELQAIAHADITEIVNWTAEGAMMLIGSPELHPAVRKSIKKVKFKRTRLGEDVIEEQFEFEMHDKMAALRVLSRWHGILERRSDIDQRPTLVGINVTGPQVPYEDETEPVPATGQNNGEVSKD